MLLPDVQFMGTCQCVRYYSHPTIACSLVNVKSVGTFASYYTQHLLLGTSFIKISLIGATDCFLVLALSGVAGRLLDAGYQRYLLATGAALVSSGMLALAFVNDDGTDRGGGSYPLTWLAQGFIQSLGMSCFFVASSQSMYKILLSAPLL